MRPRAQYLTLHEVLLVVCVLVGLGILLSMLAPVARERLRRRACERNLRSISLSMLMYSDDYGRFFPGITIDSGYKDDNKPARVMTLGYDASGNHPGNRWMHALFIDGHTEGRRPDGRGVITYNIPGGQQTSYWNRNDW